MFIKLNEDEAAEKSRAKTAQVLVSHCTELQTEEGLSHRALFSDSPTSFGTTRTPARPLPETTWARKVER